MEYLYGIYVSGYLRRRYFWGRYAMRWLPGDLANLVSDFVGDYSCYPLFVVGGGD